MDRRTYERTKETDFIGQKVISLRSMKNGLYRFPAGMTFTIKRKQGGFELQSDPCPHCGIQAYINKVQPIDVNFTDQQGLWPPISAEKI